MDIRESSHARSRRLNGIRRLGSLRACGLSDRSKVVTLDSSLPRRLEVDGEALRKCRSGKECKDDLHVVSVKQQTRWFERCKSRIPV